MAKSQDNGGTATLEPPKTQESKTPQAVAQPVQPTEVLKFELLDGQHAGYNRVGESRLWNKGDIVECYHIEWHRRTREEIADQVPRRIKAIKPFNLARRFNQPDALKFRKVNNDMPSSVGILLDQGNPVMSEGDREQYDDNLINPRKPNQKVQRNDGNDDIFDSMGMAELKKYAEENEIPLGEAESRDALLYTIRQYENSAAFQNQ